MNNLAVRKQHIKRTIFVSTPIGLDRIRALRQAGYLPVIKHTDSIPNARTLRLRMLEAFCLIRLETAQVIFKEQPTFETARLLRTRRRHLARVRRLLAA